MIREDDLQAVHAFDLDLDARGRWYPLDVGVQSFPTLRHRYDENGFWSDDAGVLLIVDHEDTLLGLIAFYRRVTYHHWDGYELAYRLYRPEFHGHGYTTEAVNLLVDYLFAARPINRIEILTMPENVASIRVAEKCGFEREGIARGAWHHGGELKDVIVHARLRDDPR